MYTVTRGNRVLKERFLGRSTLEATKAAARAEYGAGVAVRRIF